jgi:hypothetical protein
VQDGAAVFSVTGKAGGIELGAPVELTVTATGRFDLLSKRLVALEWKQKDVRGQGPASPAVEVEVTTRLTRAALPETPRELNTVALSSVPAEDAPPALVTLLSHRDAKGRFKLLYPREWRVVGSTEDQTVFRLMDHGDFVAQATLTPWKSAEPGKHLAPEEFKALMAQTPGWEMEEVVEESVVPSDAGRWIYRVTTRGKMEDTKVVQTFYLIAWPSGEQLVAAFTMKTSHVNKVGTRDVALVNAIDRGK